jgi:predicted small integral membrane protein
MNIRLLKIILVEFVALLALLYATQNIVNIEAALSVVGAVLSMEGHEYYASSLGPAITHPVLVALATWTIIAFEYAAGLFAAKGAWDMWKTRSAPAEQFNASKANALLGAGIGVIVWLGLFGVIGGAYFQMWQTELGANSLAGAFQYAMMCAVVLIFVNMADT